MKIGKFERDGRSAHGIVDGNSVHLVSDWYDTTDTWHGFGLPALHPDAIARLPVRATVPLSTLTCLPPIDLASKLVCIGLNYKEHADEVGRDQRPVPGLFLRTFDSVQGHQAPIVKPACSEQYDFEGEIAVVIGKPGRAIAAADAMNHVFGYSCFMDGSVRDFQTHSVTAGKNFWQSGAMGPWIVTADEVPDPLQLQLTTTLNGQVVQRSSAAMLIYSIPTLIAYISQWTPLRAGDVIATGTPAGVGLSRKPPLWLQPGDALEVRIDPVGTLANTVVQG